MHANCIASPGFHVDFDAQLISWHNRPPKARLLNSRKNHKLVLTIRNLCQQQCAARLRHSFNDQHTRHDRHVRKVPGEKWLINGDIFNRHNALHAHEVDHTINQQKRIAMRQNSQNIVNIQLALLGGWRFSQRLRRVGHVSSGLKIILYCTFWQARENGKQRMTFPSPSEQLRYFQKQQSKIVETIRQLVEIESPSDVKQAVDRLGTVVASRFSELGGRVHVHLAENFGNHLQIDFNCPNAPKHKPVLLLGHMDTVYPIGTISRMPCRVAKGRLWGPGVLDMKSGIALAIHAIEALLKWNDGTFPRPVRVLLASDEEVGSKSSRVITERLATKSAAVLVLEPAHGLAVKTARKGVCEYRLLVSGRAAHAGLDFEKGQSAIVELAEQIREISKLVDLKRGITVNVGRVTGGTRSNVVAAEAEALIDVRVSRMADALRIDQRLRSLKPINPSCRIKVSGGMNRPPMERAKGVADLYARAKAIARELGWELPEASVGGGSDGNFTAALRIPTLDGLGGIGEGAHAEHESIIISELPRRASLLSGLITRI